MKPKTNKKKEKTQKRKKGETLDEKVHRHIKDKDDIITDEDLRDVKVGTITEQEKKQSQEFADEFSKKKKKTPWDILDEENK